MKTPLVSICCLCYNHEKFIRQCIEGFLIQKVNFDIEIIINDDASQDDSVRIITEYQSKYPNLFVCVFQKENQYSKGVNLLSLIFSKARGKYIAYCEGDDYWTDPLKLQKQVQHQYLQFLQAIFERQGFLHQLRFQLNHWNRK